RTWRRMRSVSIDSPSSESPRCYLMEKLEFHSAPAEHFVEGTEYGVAHSGLHLPEDGPAILEDDAHHAPHRRAGGVVRSLWVSTLEAEDEIVQAANERRVGEEVVRAVAAEPGDPFLVLDRLEAAGDDAVFQYAEDHGHTERQDDPGASEIDVPVEIPFHTRAHALAKI